MTLFKAFTYANHLNTASAQQDGEGIARLMSLSDPHCPALLATLGPVWQDQLNAILSVKKNAPWREMVKKGILRFQQTTQEGQAVAHIEVIIQQSQRDSSCSPTGAYDAQARSVAAFLRWFTLAQNNRWALPTLYTISRDLRALAADADKYLFKLGQKASRLSDCASRYLMKGFSACMSDRGGVLETSRRWGTYSMANLLFKTYFKLRATALCKNVKRAIDSASDLPPLSVFPMDEQVAFRYHMGVFAFLSESYALAESDLIFAFRHCPNTQRFATNRELILTYLIPLVMQKGILPSPELLRPHPNLDLIYAPLREATRIGDVRKYDETLSWAEKRLLDSGTYLAAESAREICLRRLLKKTWLVQQNPGAAPVVKLDLDTFATSFRLAAIDTTPDEVECILANMIYKNMIKGYLSHAQQKIVLSQKDPFPRA